ncbi:MAG: COX15/CtaA family protein, partial [Solirubrobacteraceae bacterium]
MPAIRISAIRIPAVAPVPYRRLAAVAAFLLGAIVVTGATVRLTSSGLGCPTWPKCTA